MSSITSYKTTAFKESQKFLVIDPSTQSPSLVLGSDLVSYITPRLNYVRADSTRLSAENTDYDVGTLVQTSGAASPGDNFAATYLVVEGGSGDFPMLNGNDLLRIRGDDLLRDQLASSDAGEGASLVSTESGASVQEALDSLEDTIEGYIFELDLTIAATSDTGLDYHSEPRVVQISDGTLVMVHQRSNDHDTNQNIIVSRRSTDLGETWSEPTTVYDPVSGFAGRNPSIGYSETGNRIIVFAREYDAVTPDQLDLVYLTSTDGGITWSAPTSVFSQFADTTRATPFGRTVQTTNGLMQTFYTSDKAWVLFSTDNGQTWGNRVTAYDLVQVSATFVEPFVVAVDDSRLIMAIRDEETKNIFWLGKSDDGGLTWPGGREQIVYSTETIDQATPACMALVGTDIYCSWAARAQDYKLYLTRVNKEFFWKEPTYGFSPTLGEPVKRLWKSNIEGGVATGAEYGYPDITSLSGKKGSALISWYDSKDGTNGTDTVIYCQSTGIS